MIKAGADVDKWDLFGRSPLYMAADVSTLPVKGNGAMAVIPSEDSVTALDVARLLLEAGANPNLQLKRRPPYRDVPQDRGGDSILAQGATPLLRAARAGDAPFVELLLKHKALVDLPSKEGVTPLMAAAGVEFGTRVTRGRNRTDEGVLATMRLLLDAGADINARMVTEPGAQSGGRRVAGGGVRRRPRGRPSQVPSASAVPHQTALHGAAERGFTPFVKFLAENGADLQAKDANGRTPLDLAKGIGVAGVRQAAERAVPRNRRPARIADGGEGHPARQPPDQISAGKLPSPCAPRHADRPPGRPPVQRPSSATTSGCRASTTECPRGWGCPSARTKPTPRSWPWRAPGGRGPFRS